MRASTPEATSILRLDVNSGFAGTFSSAGTCDPAVEIGGAGLARSPSVMAVTTQVEPITDAVHLCTDMQNIFAPGHIWETPSMERVLPRIVEIAARHPARTVFTRFITPMHADDRPGRWHRYFRKWHRLTRAELPASELELVPALRRFVPPAEIVDKPAYQEGHPQHSSPSWGMNCERCGDYSASRSRDRRSCSPANEVDRSRQRASRGRLKGRGSRQWRRQIRVHFPNMRLRRCRSSPSSCHNQTPTTDP